MLLRSSIAVLLLVGFFELALVLTSQHHANPQNFWLQLNAEFKTNAARENAPLYWMMLNAQHPV